MAKKQIATGVAHNVPADLRKALTSDESALEQWEDLTPLARNDGQRLMPIPIYRVQPGIQKHAGYRAIKTFLT